ncbi:uncharacterized protein BCR38DRAFT_413439 [Pseudomassariella vexata]|uniref:Uncharacterized protein n=1 Tax=Pseudomassariella vexata TaxID=1141098 RepID=A0A1Y2DFF8_9PEZI|nr:uncharacterized protein BCR38DRAFT_413439 [Pseudomassariella vexata]ORY58023.1 hypothetical protein BCR38DRAFT_413439 [Pseudomassariella vexata]
MTAMEDIKAKYRQGSLRLCDTAQTAKEGDWPYLTGEVSNKEPHPEETSAEAGGPFSSQPQTGQTPTQRLLDLQYQLCSASLDPPSSSGTDSNVSAKISNASIYTKDLTNILEDLDDCRTASRPATETGGHGWSWGLTTSVFMTCYLCLTEYYNTILETLKSRDYVTPADLNVATEVHQLTLIIKHLQRYIQKCRPVSSTPLADPTSYFDLGRRSNTQELEESGDEEGKAKQAFEMDAFGFTGLYRDFDLVSPGGGSEDYGQASPIAQVTSRFAEEVSERHRRMMELCRDVNRIADKQAWI